MGIFYGVLFSIDDLSNNKFTKLLKYGIINPFTITLFPSIIGISMGAINEILRIKENYIFY